MGDKGAEGREQLRRELERLAPDDESLDVSAAFLSSVLAHIPAMVSVVAPDGRFLFVNRLIPGLTLDDVLGKTMFDFMPEDVHAVARDALAKVMQTGELGDYVGYGEGQAGPRSRYENWIGPIHAGDKVIAMTVITRDTSIEWEVQQRLIDREKRLLLALESAGMGMYRFDLETGRTELDERVQAIYGIDADHFEPGDEGKYIHPDDLDTVRDAARRCMGQGEAYHMENRVRRADGSEGWVSGHGVPLYDEAGTLTGMLGTLLDISERRELEDRLRQAQKLEAVGQLTAGIAHNFNNMLASIVPTLDLLALDVSAENAQTLVAATAAASRATQMVRELMTFAGKNRSRSRRREHLAPLLERTISICRTTFDRSIELDVSLDDDVPPIDVDSAQIEQTLMNILINARDALRDSGAESPRVGIRVDAPPEPPQVELDGSVSRWVRIAISDNGTGMSREVRERAFEPFFTTKEVGRGTGLGLSTGYAIVQKHGGFLFCDAPAGQGATFTIWLPAASGELVETHGVASQPEPQASKQKVLLVDDEHVVRQVVAQVLRNGGYEVRTAATGQEALRSLTADRDVDVVLFDLNMPGMPWKQLIARLERIAPNAKRVVYTGQPLDEEVDNVDALLEKPADGETILGCLQAVLANVPQ